MFFPGARKLNKHRTQSVVLAMNVVGRTNNFAVKRFLCLALPALLTGVGTTARSAAEADVRRDATVEAVAAAVEGRCGSR